MIISLIRGITIRLFLLIQGVIDKRYKKIRQELCIVITIFGIILLFVENQKISENIIFLGMAVIPGVLLCLISWITKGSIGIGDGYVVITMGVYIGGMNTFIIIMMAFAMVAFLGMLVMIIKNKRRDMEIAFVPFICLGYILESVMTWF